MALMLILICKGPSGRGLEFAAELNGHELVEASIQPSDSGHDAATLRRAMARIIDVAG